MEDNLCFKCKCGCVHYPQIFIKMKDGKQLRFCSPGCLQNHYDILAHYELLPYDTDTSLTPKVLVQKCADITKQQREHYKKIIASRANEK